MNGNTTQAKVAKSWSKPRAVTYAEKDLLKKAGSKLLCHLHGHAHK